MRNDARKLFRFLRTKPVPANTNEILALERTKLANERTLLSYIRSSLYLLVGGIALIQLKEYENLNWIGYLALFICVVFLTVGIFRYVLLYRRLHKWNRILFAETIPDPRDKKEKEKEKGPVEPIIE